MGGIVFLIIAFVILVIILSAIRSAKAKAAMIQRGGGRMRHGTRGMNRRRVSYGGRTFYIYIGDDGYYYDEDGYVIDDPDFGDSDFIDDDDYVVDDEDDND
mgnify:FL=1